MNITEFEGNWNEQKGKLRQKFAVLLLLRFNHLIKPKK